MNLEFLRFAGVGIIGFVVDGGGTWLLTHLGLSPFIARVPCLVAAMIVTWLLHRSLTFRVDKPRSAAELTRFLAVSLSAAAMNFLLYSGLVLLGVHPLLAVMGATVMVMFYSFLAYRHAVFR